MKTLFLFLALVFLVQATPNPQADPEADPGEITDSVAQPAEENEAAGADPRNVINGPCYGTRGYCYLRVYRCISGSAFNEVYNDCSDKRSYQCCVP